MKTPGGKKPAAAVAHRKSRARTAATPTPIRILHVTPEAAPFARTGGLGDVAGALASAQAKAGARVALLMPLYRTMRGDIGTLVPIAEIGGAELLRREPEWAGVSIYFVRHDLSFSRDGLYGTTAGDYPDNALRFSWLAEAAIALALHESFDVLHLHDWQAALVAVLLQGRPDLRERLPTTRTLLSIHNLAYQGLAPRRLLRDLALPATLGSPDLMGDGEAINLLKGGLLCADGLSTVSRTYVREVQTQENGRGLDLILRDRKADLVGVKNGIDVEVWDPARDPLLASPFSAKDPRGKAACRRALLRELRLTGNEEEPILGFVGRLVEQKGVDLLLGVLDEITPRARVVILGNGDPDRERAVVDAARASSGRIAAWIGFDDGNARRLLAGVDLLVVPSRYEPCGLVQMYGMRYGALPVAHRTGGLAETIREGKTGFLFGKFDDKALLRAIDKAIEAIAKPARRLAMIRAAMAQDFSWNESVAAYTRLYARLLKRPPRSVPLPAAETRIAFASADGNGVGKKEPTPAPMPFVPTPSAARSSTPIVLPHGHDVGRVAILAQGPRRLYSYWRAEPDVEPAEEPRVECRETGIAQPILGPLPSGDRWIAAEPQRHYRVVMGSMVTGWVRTPPEVAVPQTASSADVWSLFERPWRLPTSRTD